MGRARGAVVVATPAPRAQVEMGLDAMAVAHASIGPNPYQPRTVFNEAELFALQADIEDGGLLQRLLVRPASEAARARGHEWELIDGERRHIVLGRLGWTTIPVDVREATDRQMALRALATFGHKVGISAIEQARAFRRDIDELGLTQEEIARAVKLTQPQVSHLLGLLDLPPGIQDLIQQDLMYWSHARDIIRPVLRQGQEGPARNAFLSDLEDEMVARARNMGEGERFGREALANLVREVMDSHFPAAESVGPPADAICVYCECTDSHGCEGGCTWVWVDREEGRGCCSNPECVEADRGRVVREASDPGPGVEEFDRIEAAFVGDSPPSPRWTGADAERLVAEGLAARNLSGLGHKGSAFAEGVRIYVNGGVAGPRAYDLKGQAEARDEGFGWAAQAHSEQGSRPRADDIPAPSREQAAAPAPTPPALPPTPARAAAVAAPAPPTPRPLASLPLPGTARSEVREGAGLIETFVAALGGRPGTISVSPLGGNVMVIIAPRIAKTGETPLTITKPAADVDAELLERINLHFS